MYYDPEVGRFINADEIDYLGADGSLTGCNLFAYCGNNPVVRADRNGNHWYYLWLDDLINAIDELLSSVSNIVYGKAAFERGFYDPKGASAASFTIGSSYGLYIGGDYYHCIN